MRILPICRKTISSFFLILVVAACFCYADQKTAEVVGIAECADCQHKNIEHSHALKGLKVTIDCKLATGEEKTRAVGELDEEGKFRVDFPAELVEKKNLKEECYAQLHRASNAPCPAISGIETSKVAFVSESAGKHTFSPVGKLKFLPATCTSAFLWPKYKYPPLPEHKFDFPKKTFPKLTLPSVPPLPEYKFPFPKKTFPKFKFPKIPCPPFFKKPVPTPKPVHKEPLPPPVPVYKPPVPVVKPPVPVYKPPVPVVKPPVPVYKPPVPVVKPPVPVYKPPVPVYKPPVPVVKKPCPPPVPKPKPLPPPVPVHVDPIPPPVPIKKPCPPPVPVYKEPLPPPVPVYKEPLPPLIPKIKKPCPPLSKILPPIPPLSPFPKTFFEHPKFKKFFKHPKVFEHPKFKKFFAPYVPPHA